MAPHGGSGTGPSGLSAESAPPSGDPTRKAHEALNPITRAY